MKESWTYKKLGEVCEIGIGRTPSRSDMSLWDKNKQTHNYWVSIADMGAADNGYITDTKEYISDKAADNIQIIPKGTLLLSFKLTLGKTAIAGMDLYTNEAIANLPFKGNEVNREFLSYYFQYFNWEKYSAGDEKVLGKTLNKKKLDVLPVYYPVPSEQQRIVSRLDAAFAHIDEMKANAEKQLSEARALFQKALTKAMEPKEGWTNMKLGEFAYMKAGDFVKASEIFSEYKDGLFPCYGGNGFRGYVRESNQDGDYCMIGRQGALCGCINRAKGIFRTTEHAVIVKPYDNIPTSLVYYMLISLNLNKYSTGAAQPGLSVKNIAEQVIISVPPKEEYNRIASRLDSLSAHVRELEEVTQKTIAECDALKQAMLRKVFE